MIYVYRVLIILLKYLVLILKPLLGNKLKSWIDLRNRHSTSVISNQKSFWFHASSGEIEYVKSVIIELRKRSPSAYIVVTYSSPSAEKLFENIQPFVNEFRPIPWDQPCAVQNVISEIQPQILIFSRTDFWPELIFQAHAKQIPICIVSYFGELGLSRRLMARWLFKKVARISCVEEKSAQQLRAVLPASVQITTDGDTRFDQVFWRLSQKSKVHIVAERPIFIAGSTWAEDEQQLVALFTQLLKKNYQIIWSPHEVGTVNIQRIRDMIKTSARTCQIFSKQSKNELQFNADFLLVDEIGYLADLYRYADIAFVGGSFKEKVHSVMEPLCCGLPVLVGPFYQNNPEAAKYVKQTQPPILYVCQNSHELIHSVQKIETERSELSAQILNLMESNRYSTQKITDSILNTVLKR